MDVAETEQAANSAVKSGAHPDFETLLSDLSSRLIVLPPAEIDGAIQDGLRRVCEFFDIDRALLWQWAAVTPAVLVPTHTYLSEEATQPPEPLRQEDCPWYVEQMLAGRTVVVAALGQLPAEASVDRETISRRGVKSNLTVPLSTGDAPPLGALGFTTTQAERDWPETVVKRLQLVAQFFANALARKRSDEALRESEERLALAADSAEAGLWALDDGTGVIWATERARVIFGFSADEVVTLDVLQSSIHPDDRRLVQEAIERSARSGESTSVECRVMTSEGDVNWILLRGRAHFATTGELGRVMGVAIDISERKRAQDALLASQNRLKAAAELAGLAIYEFDYVNDSAYLDDSYRDICGLPPDIDPGIGPLMAFWAEHIHPKDRARVMEVRTRLHDGRLERLSVEYRYLHPTRGRTWLEHLAVIARRDAASHPARSFGVLRDVTERRQAETELRDLSRRLISAHEEERALLARELHDDFSQRLAVLAIEVGRAELAAPDGEQAEAMCGVREGLVRLSEDIHTLAYQLHPSVLEELGLGEALRAECERRAHVGGLGISVNLDPLTATVAEDAAFCLFRVAQEALNNVARHAAAKAASVRLRQMDGGLVLAVSDDGAGFDAKNLAAGMHLGLAGMRERLKLVNGTLEIDSEPGRGTTVIAWVPVKDESS